MFIASITLAVVGILIIMGGYTIRKKGNTSFIAGNNELFIPKNEKQLADRIGWVVILFGIETVAFPVFFNFIKVIEGYHFVILAALHLVIIFIFMVVDQIGIRDL